MACAPGLDAAFGNGVAIGQIIQLLKSVVYLQLLFQPGAHHFLEIFFNGVLDDKDDLFKAGAHGVVDGVVQNDLAVGADGIDLLQSAVTGTHAGGHNDQNGLFHRGILHVSI